MSWAVIGAGAAGLSCARALQRNDVPVVVYEATDHVGGVWRAPVGGGSGMYPNVSLISSKRLTEFRELRMDDVLPDYLDQEAAADYLDSYARQFELMPLVRLNCRVLEAAPVGISAGSRWRLRFHDGDEEVHEGVVVANGHHRIPHTPSIRGLSGGLMRAVSTVTSWEDLLSQRVLVIGGGNSGTDAAVNLGRLGARVVHAMRTQRHCIPKQLAGQPVDAILDTLQRRDRPLWAQQALAELCRRLAYGRAANHPLLRPEHPILTGKIVPTDDYPRLVSEGLITVRSAPVEVDGHRVEFADGSSETFDIVLNATGYEVSFPFLAEGDRPRLDGEPPVLNLLSREHRTLLFSGLFQSDSGAWWLFERQADVIAAYVRAQRSTRGGGCGAGVLLALADVRHRYQRQGSWLNVTHRAYERELCAATDGLNRLIAPT